MPFSFSQLQVASSEPFMTIETAVKIAASSADIHKFSAYNQLDDSAPWENVGSFPAAASLTYSGGHLTVGAGAKMKRVRGVDRMVRFTATGSSPVPGVIFYSSDGAGNNIGYRVSQKSTAYTDAYIYPGPVLCIIQNAETAFGRPGGLGGLSISTLGQNTVEIYFTERRYSSASNEYWVVISVYCNDRIINTMSVKRTSSLSDYPFHYVGFEGSATYYDVHVSGAGEVADPLTIDPGDAGAAGLNRVLDGLNYKMMLRFDETMHVFRTAKGPNFNLTWDVYDEDVVPGQIEYQYDHSQIKPYVRVVGAYEQADFVNTEWAEKYGDRFALVNNSYLLTLAAVRTEARLAFLRMLEAYLTAVFSTQHNPFIEPEDRININEEPFIVTGFNVSWSQTDAAQDFEVRNNPHE